MKNFLKQYSHELIIYAVLWLIIFLIPIIDIYLKASSNSSLSFSWSIVGKAWLAMIPFFILFLIHNYGLLPCFLFRKKTTVYILSVFVTLAVFYKVEEYTHPFQRMKFSKTEQHAFPPEDFPRSDKRKRPFRPDRMRPEFIMHPIVSRLVLAILMLGVNVAVKLFFKSKQDEEVLKELERHNLQQELEYLKYQINPHFFMNTLNNIHALVDIDAEKAKSTIVELSKMMRYVLYEGSNRSILLSKEVEFLNNYIELMRLRYTDKVKIEVSIPENIPEIRIPPLLFISFIENAFKHGVSYQTDSFIKIAVEPENGNIMFRCSNSNFGRHDKQHSGIGLENIRKRLKLLYNNDYTLSIKEQSDTFNVLLIIPIV